jgi:DNA-binding SARP family transcriptional activator
LKQVDRALEDLDEAIRLQPQFVQPYLMRAEIYAATDRLDEATAQLERLVQMSPGNVPLLNRLGSFYWHFKDRRDLVDAVLTVWRDGRIRDIRKQTSAEPGEELAALHHTIDVYSAAKNRKGIAIEAAIRIWARQDPPTAAVVEEVDATRLDCTRQLFVALGLPEAEAKARSVLLYAYVFGFSMMQCGQFAMDAAETKRWITARITQ